MHDPDRLLAAALPDPGDWHATELRRAAVLCPIVSHQGADHLLFVLRPEGRHQHAGQIAFPGGMREEGESPLQTAVRECFEEVGTPPSVVTPLGELSPIRSTSMIHVHCIVARLADFELRPDAREVARILHMPLAELRDETRWSNQPAPPPNQPPADQPAPTHAPRTSPHFEFEGDLLWGLTARFVRQLLAHLP